MTIHAFSQFILTASERCFFKFFLIISNYEYCRKIIAAGRRFRGHVWSWSSSINTHKYFNITFAPSISRIVSHMMTRFVVPKMPLLRTACSTTVYVANRVEEDSSPGTKEIHWQKHVKGNNTDNTVLIFSRR